jgi:hypothetical protein
MKGKRFNIEIKFALPNREFTNETGMSRHEIYKVSNRISHTTRHRKFVLKKEILQRIEEVLQSTPQLVDELGNSNRESAKERLRDYANS